MSLVEKERSKQRDPSRSEGTPSYQTYLDQELISVLKETKELNDLMRAYIRTDMDKASAEKMTFETEIETIKQTSSEATEKMLLTLTKQDDLLKRAAEMLQKVLKNGQKEMKENNQKTLEKLEDLQQANKKQLNAIQSNLESSTQNMNKNIKETVENAKKDSETMVSNAKRGALATYWMDAFKYGLATSIVIVPIYFLIRFIFSWIGIEIP